MVAACGDDEEASDPGLGAMLAGPYPTALELTEQTRMQVPPGTESLASDAEVLFYWYAQEASGKSIVFEVRAEATALEAGTVIHRVEERVPQGQAQGMFGVTPRELNRGGTRMVDGHPRWLDGIYSVRIFVDDAELATGIFEVR